MEKNGIWHSTFRIPAYMVDTHRKATLTTICNFLQEAAGEHALYHQLGYEDMKAKGQFWILNRLRVRMQTMPDWRSTIEIHTWVDSMKGPFSYRNFAIYDDQHNLLGSACALWVLLDAASRRPIRIQAHSLPILTDKPGFCGQPEKLKPLTNFRLLDQRTVRYSDLDMIGHVNNVSYIAWLLDCLDTREAPLHAIDINYLKESFLNDELEVYQEDNCFSIRKKGSNEDLCRVGRIADDG